MGHKANLHRYRKFGIHPYISLDHHGLKLKFNNNAKSRKPTNTWKLNNSQLNPLGQGRYKEIKGFLEFNEKECIEQYESSTKRKLQSTKCLHKNVGEIPHKQISRTFESSRTKTCKLTQKERMPGNNQIKG